MKANTFFESWPANRPPTMLIGRNRIFMAPLLSILQLACAARLEEWLAILGEAALDLPAALELGVELGTEQDHRVRDPQPDEEDDHPAERAVRLVVATEVRHVERERGRGNDPQQHSEHATWADPLELRMLHVGGRPVEQREHEA